MKNTVDASFDILTGRSEEYLVPCWSGQLVHRDALGPLEVLRDEAKSAGFDLAVASSYRGFDRQLLIWQEKVAGKRQVLDANEEPLDPRELSEEELLWSILHWSALPGTSRHHWGTDLDVFDARALDRAGVKLQLTVAECERDGPLFDFHCWLDEVIAAGKSAGFFRPYDRDRGGVAVEPWHLSYGPVSKVLQEAFDFEVFRQLLSERKWPLHHIIDNHAREIFDRYVSLVE